MLRGQQRRIVGGNTSSADPATNIMVVSRADFIDVIRDITRGWEMPGTFSPLTVGNLFGHKSQPQLQPARQNLKPVSQAARSSLDLLNLPLNQPNQPPKPSLTTPIDRKINDMIQNLDEILTPSETGHPITYNTITASPRTVQQVRKKAPRSRDGPRAEEISRRHRGR